MQKVEKKKRVSAMLSILYMTKTVSNIPSKGLTIEKYVTIRWDNL